MGHLGGTYDVSGKMQDAEIVSNKKGFKADEMYDGGEDEEAPAPVEDEEP
jgi:hypothetical protein